MSESVSPAFSDGDGYSEFEIPSPKNKCIMVYTKPEAVEILLRTKSNLKERCAVMQEIIKLTWAPTSRTTLYRLTKMAERSELILDNSWSGN